ncbi:MAG: hypothetical protein WD029_04505 [Microthrixaceae bacterium]
MNDSWWQRKRNQLQNAATRRVKGFPQSSNRASSFHLNWQIPSQTSDGGSVQNGLTALEVTLEVLEPPSVDRLYFWAVQANFTDGQLRQAGGAHLGLQWHPGHPGCTAVNWGGYDHQGTILSGSESALPSKMANPNTRDFFWQPRVPYRLRIERITLGSQSFWRGSVTEVQTGAITVVRDLYPTGDFISGVTMWSEIFARCDDPSVAIRWTDAQAEFLDSTVLRPAAFLVNYQSHQDGGCANSDSFFDGLGIVQRTAVQRSTQQGQLILGERG